MSELEEKYRIEGGFPVRIVYYTGSPYLKISSETSYVSGGDWGSGYHYSADWELKIPVYGGDWKKATEKAKRRYRLKVQCSVERKRLNEELLNFQTDPLLRLIVELEHKPEKVYNQLLRAGYVEVAQVFAEHAFCNSISRNFSLQEAEKIAGLANLSLPDEWEQDKFDDLVIRFLETGCKAKSENIILSLLEQDQVSTQKILADILPKVWKGALEEEGFWGFLEENGIFSGKLKGQWVLEVTQTLIKGWAEKTFEAQSGDWNQVGSEKEAIVLWKKLGQWCIQHSVSREEIQMAVADLMENPRATIHPLTAELYERMFDIYSPLVERVIVKYLSLNIKEDVHTLYPKQSNEAIQIALVEEFRFDRSMDLLEDWVPLSWEEKRELAERFLNEFIAEPYNFRMAEAMKIYEKFGLHIPEIEAYRDLLEQSGEETASGKGTALVKPKTVAIANFSATDSFCRRMWILSEKGPTADIRIYAGEVFRHLEYALDRDFPESQHGPGLNDFMMAILNPQDVFVGFDLVSYLEEWLESEPELGEDSRLSGAVKDFSRAVGEFHYRLNTQKEDRNEVFGFIPGGAS